MSIHLNQLTRIEGAPAGVFFTYGRDDNTGRFGGAHRNGTVGLHDFVKGRLTYRTIKCSSYRKAQRKLLQYLKGYNVC